MNTFLRAFAWCAAGILAMAPSALAQTAPPESMPPGTRANPLPISGRTGQTGSVTVTQTTNPGGETVNTLNSSVQAQGPYSEGQRSDRAEAGSADDDFARRRGGAGH